jgi:hypothetical protein
LLLSLIGGVRLVSTDESPWKSKHKMTNLKPSDRLSGGFTPHNWGLYWPLEATYCLHLQDDWIWLLCIRQELGWRDVLVT